MRSSLKRYQIFKNFYLEIKINVNKKFKYYKLENFFLL